MSKLQSLPLRLAVIMYETRLLCILWPMNVTFRFHCLHGEHRDKQANKQITY